MPPSWLLCSVVLALLVGLSSQQRDPLDDFCRRFGHQTTVVDDKLYIDGGYINYRPLEQNPLNYSNRYLIHADFNVSNEGFPQQFANLSKAAEVPTVHGGVLWPDPVNKWVHLYGGEYVDGAPDTFSLWSYDIINNTWNATQVRDLQIQRASYGAGTTDEEQAMGYYYGGWLSNASVPGFGPRIPTSNLIIYNMMRNEWSNNTGPDSIPRTEGVLLHIPASDAGMLVHLGGLQFPDFPENDTAEGVPMNEIRLYDIANSKWYMQNATGDIPEMRNKFCAGATWADDRSSYNIYVYGGASMPPNTSGFDDVYILTIPSFRWIKWYPEQPGASYPHHSLSCNVFRRSQMIVMGGSFPNSTACDVPAIHGQHNLNLGKNNIRNSKWYQFLPNVTEYNVPSEIIDEVGGDARGHATATAPANWANPDLETYFQLNFVASSRTPTRYIPAATSTYPAGSRDDSGTNTGAIAGGTVGGVVFLVASLGLLLFFCRRARRKRASTTIPPPPPPPAELDHQDTKIYPGTKGHPAPMAELDSSDPNDPIKHGGGYYAIPPSSPSYSQTLQGTPEPSYDPSIIANSNSPPIPAPYYTNPRDSQSITYAPSHLSTQFTGSTAKSPWPVEQKSLVHPEPFYPPPPVEMAAGPHTPVTVQHHGRDGNAEVETEVEYSVAGDSGEGSPRVSPGLVDERGYTHTHSRSVSGVSEGETGMGMGERPQTGS